MTSDIDLRTNYNCDGVGSGPNGCCPNQGFGYFFNQYLCLSCESKISNKQQALLEKKVKKAAKAQAKEEKKEEKNQAKETKKSEKKEKKEKKTKKEKATKHACAGFMVGKKNRGQPCKRNGKFTYDSQYACKYHFEHGLCQETTLPLGPCDGLVMSGPRKGLQCNRKVCSGKTYCSQHVPQAPPKPCLGKYKSGPKKKQQCGRNTKYGLDYCYLHHYGAMKNLMKTLVVKDGRKKLVNKIAAVVLPPPAASSSNAIDRPGWPFN